MPARNEKRDAAKAEYLAALHRGEKVNLKELAEKLGVQYQQLRNWKSKDKWDSEAPKKKRGAQPGNKNSKGHRNAAGHHDGAPKGNKNAEKDGAYSTIFFDMLSDEEKELAEKTPFGSREALQHELQILKVREHRILEKIAKYENADEDQLFISSLTDMRVPGVEKVTGKSKKTDGAIQTMGMYAKDSAFTRVLKLEEALYKVQGRIATIANSLRALEETKQRLEVDKRRLDIMYMRAIGTVEVEDPAAGLFEGMDSEEMPDEAIHE